MNERTPTLKEWKKVRKEKIFEWMQVERHELLPKGSGLARQSIHNCKRFLEKKAQYRPVLGFMVYVGEPTKLLIMPHSWVVDSGGEWFDVTNIDESETHVFCFTSQREDINNWLAEWYLNEWCTKAIAKRVVLPHEHVCVHHLMSANDPMALVILSGVVMRGINFVNGSFTFEDIYKKDVPKEMLEQSDRELEERYQGLEIKIGIKK
jgi:hypothetical protein